MSEHFNMNIEPVVYATEMPAAPKKPPPTLVDVNKEPPKVEVRVNEEKRDARRS